MRNEVWKTFMFIAAFAAAFGCGYYLSALGKDLKNAKQKSIDEDHSE